MLYCCFFNHQTHFIKFKTRTFYHICQILFLYSSFTPDVPRFLLVSFTFVWKINLNNSFRGSLLTANSFISFFFYIYISSSENVFISLLFLNILILAMEFLVDNSINTSKILFHFCLHSFLLKKSSLNYCFPLSNISFIFNCLQDFFVVVS